MNYNILAYIVFLSMIIYIIVFVGRYFFTNGRVFILNLFNNNEEQADTINRILLIAYYLFNIGYSFMILRKWEKVHNTSEMFSSITENMSLLIIILAVMHYFNMTVIYILSKKSNSLTNKTFQL